MSFLSVKFKEFALFNNSSCFLVLEIEEEPLFINFFRLSLLLLLLLFKDFYYLISLTSLFS